MIWVLVFSAFASLSAVFPFYKILQLYQLSAYRPKELFTALKRKYFVPAISLAVLFGAIFCAVIAVTHFAEIYSGWLSVLYFAAEIFLFLFYYKTSVKVVTLTKRFKRFLTVMTAFNIVLGLGIGTASFFCGIGIALPCLMPIVCFVTFILAHYLTKPFENVRNTVFIKKAKEKLANANVIKIGITGSYGKTTAKNILENMLSPKFPVCVTEGNYNTPLGIAITVNDKLKKTDKIFIAEMGARYKGDIKELCDIVKPNIAIITGIGTQHLETFGSIEALEDTKFEITQDLGEDGIAVFNTDSEGGKRLFDRYDGPKLCSGNNDVCDANYSDVRITKDGTFFKLNLLGERTEIFTKLAGDYAVSAITLCALAAKVLGADTEEIKKTAAELKPVAHRLEMIYNENGDIIIDDSYNSNESGALSALKVLGSFTDKTRIVITPGLVELGRRQKAANADFGRNAAKYCDIVIAVGKNAGCIKAGALAGGMEADKVITVKNLGEAMSEYSNTKGGKAVLFENDLPDNY